MTRDMDYVRELLLSVEALNKPTLANLLPENAAQADYDNLAGHLEMLIEQAGLVKGIEAHSMVGKNWLDLRLTWQGCDYLDAIRDPDIWAKTKDGAAAAGGFTLDILSALAKGLIKQKIMQHTGVDIDL